MSIRLIQILLYQIRLIIRATLPKVFSTWLLSHNSPFAEAFSDKSATLYDLKKPPTQLFIKNIAKKIIVPDKVYTGYNQDKFPLSLKNSFFNSKRQNE